MLFPPRRICPVEKSTIAVTDLFIFNKSPFCAFSPSVASSVHSHVIPLFIFPIGVISGSFFLSTLYTALYKVEALLFCFSQ